MNRTFLIGNVVKEPEVRQTNDGRPVCNLVLATNEYWKDKDENKKEKTEFHRITVFSEGIVTVIKNYVHKGMKLFIEGKLQTRKWDDNGTERYVTEIILQGYNCTLTILDKPNKPQEAEPVDDMNQDVPF
jgi:single-strand DNA-binding protein